MRGKRLNLDAVAHGDSAKAFRSAQSPLTAAN